MLLYSGGMPRASYGDRHCLTIQQDKEHVTLDFTSRVIDFFTIHNMEPDKGDGPTLIREFTMPFTWIYPLILKVKLSFYTGFWMSNINEN